MKFLNQFLLMVVLFFCFSLSSVAQDDFVSEEEALEILKVELSEAQEKFTMKFLDQLINEIQAGQTVEESLSQAEGKIVNFYPSNTQQIAQIRQECELVLQEQ